MKTNKERSKEMIRKREMASLVNLFSRKEKIEFCEELIGNIKKLIMESIDRVPEKWDGIELRWFIAEVFNEQCVFGEHRDKRSKRYRDYHNDAVVNCL